MHEFQDHLRDQLGRAFNAATIVMVDGPTEFVGYLKADHDIPATLQVPQATWQTLYRVADVLESIQELRFSVDDITGIMPQVDEYIRMAQDQLRVEDVIVYPSTSDRVGYFGKLGPSHAAGEASPENIAAAVRGFERSVCFVPMGALRITNEANHDAP